ncbi:hypothetical protein [Enterococcus sp. DIV1420a]|uniref:hypothetical protein n=1 Tax=Enterococcus sp. DIV1420a TaxID=2774672 RepID=UPI003F687135
MRIRKYRVFKSNQKRGLAALNPNPVTKLRQTQAIAYVSLFGNIVFIGCIFAMLLARR